MLHSGACTRGTVSQPLYGASSTGSKVSHLCVYVFAFSFDRSILSRPRGKRPKIFYDLTTGGHWSTLRYYVPSLASVFDVKKRLTTTFRHPRWILAEPLVTLRPDSNSCKTLTLPLRWALFSAPQCVPPQCALWPPVMTRNY